MKQKKIYNGIDIVKLVSAICIYYYIWMGNDLSEGISNNYYLFNNIYDNKET